ncbi:MAG: Mut7-C RNAse domain-containing protein [Deltaproteobacteria bacterium]|nr:Mut7-C RNAse domain-containing protein [Deltaproteobacteria bacterium]RLB91171.1 MAG: hypothetical protein DRH10_02505 [Deltaproteobacteria bacterium]RLB96352.1 MAG: hypothetical protein DRH50_01500 [Deltaproteobacteria bacterium]RLC11829.1 MAG: hypothetical protein DRH43_03260 [Deltaproteobacteria bacterium]
MKFAADRMLGKLARWLRLLGYDTIYFNEICNDQFLALAKEGRILLSRNTRLKDKVETERFLFIESDDFRAQLQEVFGKLALTPDPEKFFTRCILCNGALEPVEASNVIENVPDYVLTAHSKFSRCNRCRKVYWPGTHVTRSLDEIERLFATRKST